MWGGRRSRCLLVLGPVGQSVTTSGRARSGPSRMPPGKAIWSISSKQSWVSLQLEKHTGTRAITETRICMSFINLKRFWNPKVTWDLVTGFVFSPFFPVGGFVPPLLEPPPLYSSWIFVPKDTQQDILERAVKLRLPSCSAVILLVYMK